jgi:hypothetical protein
MLRARRLKQIAEANQSVFAATTETEWWLEEAPTSGKSSQAVPAGEPKNASPRQAEAASKVESVSPAVQEQEPAAKSAYSVLSFLRKAEATNDRQEKDEMTWDPKRACFVMTA